MDGNSLIIVESPNKVKTITKILHDAGYKNFKVMASVGHIMELADNRNTYMNTGIDVDHDFKMNLRVSPDKVGVVNSLKTAAKKADTVYLMTDPDREGAAIAWSLIEFLKIPHYRYKRVITHEITPQAVVHAIENPIPLEIDLVEAAKARMCIDKLIGYTLSPIARTYTGARSVGRCQSVGLELVADREREIAEFKPEKYFELYLNFKKSGKDYQAKYAGTEKKKVDRLKSKEEVKRVEKLCSKDYIVSNIETKKRKEAPSAPFSTATFQQEASSKLGLGVRDAMSCAQKLFEGLDLGGEHVGLITYMRTDSTVISKEFIPILKEYVEENYGQYVAPRQAKKSANEQDGHEALRVVDPSMTPEKLEKYISDKRVVSVYRLIWQRTIASAMPDAEISETIYTAENNKQLFKMSQKELIKPGFKQVYGVDKDTATEPILALKEKLENCELVSKEKSTQPSARYTEASLVKTLESSGVGRPSTYATIVETVLSPSRGYATLQDKKIVPTDRGMQLAAFLERAFPDLINLNYTRNMEVGLDDIANHRIPRDIYLGRFFFSLKESVDNNTEKLTGVENPKCPLCGADMKVRRSRFGKLFYGCSRFPECRGLLNFKTSVS